MHVNESDFVRDVAALLKRVQGGAEIVVERDARPFAVIRAAAAVRHTLADSIALAKSHENETGSAPVLDPDFADDVEQIIRNRKPRIPPSWD
jgi:antitoxin (DNA-binding transcriptional repressor) of toxin-antitoxin stability system